MKKILTLSALFLFSLSAIAQTLMFKTSCSNDYIPVRGIENLTRSELITLLKDINEINCGTKNVTITFS